MIPRGTAPIDLTSGHPEVDDEGFARPGWGDRVRVDVNAFVFDLDGPEGLAQLEHTIHFRLGEAMRMRDHIEGRAPYPSNPPKRKVSTIEIHIRFK